MAETTHEEAARCPWCKTPGKLVKTTRSQSREVKRGTKVEVYECTNVRCKNGPQEDLEISGERWLIQINPDGTIPPKGTSESQPKEYDINNHTTEDERQRARDSMRLAYEQSVQKP